jgi:hypothetical protein
MCAATLAACRPTRYAASHSHTRRPWDKPAVLRNHPCSPLIIGSGGDRACIGTQEQINGAQEQINDIAKRLPAQHLIPNQVGLGEAVNGIANSASPFATWGGEGRP